MIEKKYIKGKFYSSYKGINKLKDDFSKNDKWDLMLFDGFIDEAVYIEKYNIAEIDIENDKTFMPLAIDDVKISFNDPTYHGAPIIFKNIVKPIIIDVKLNETIEQGANTYGKFTGIIYATLEDKKGAKYNDFNENTISPVQIDDVIRTNTFWDKISKWISLFLKFLALFFLIYIIWCFLFGNCNCNSKHNNIVPCPCDSLISKKDSLRNAERDSLLNTIDSTNRNKFLDSLNENKLYTDTSEYQEIHEGQVEVGLEWSDINDLDLYLVTPKFDTIYYNNRSYKNNGFEIYLDVDANADNYSDEGIEHIYIPVESKTIKGQYQVFVRCYKYRLNCLLTEDKCLSNYTSYVKMKIDGVEKLDNFRGFVNFNESKTYYLENQVLKNENYPIIKIANFYIK